MVYFLHEFGIRNHRQSTNFPFMKRLLVPALLLLLVLAVYFLKKDSIRASYPQKEREEEAQNHRDRLKYELDLVKNPITGKVPAGIYQQELAQAMMAPVKEGTISTSVNGVSKETANNSYIPAGPYNVGGRTRALAYDIRFASTQVIIASSVSGGIMRSSDGGNSWTLVNPTTSDVHSFTAIVQDPRAGFQDTWYAGGGELFGNSASEIGAPYLGWGLWKSVNNGVSWTKLSFTIDDISGLITGNTIEDFDHPFDLVYRLAVNPVNGHLYIACHRRLVRSTNGGLAFETVFGSSVTTTSAAGQTDVAVASDGRVYVAQNGAHPSAAMRGVHVSLTGDRNSFQRIAGGQTIGVDSIQGWRGNATNQGSKRIVITLAPSNTNIGYVFYENGLSSDPPTLSPEADLFHFSTSANTYTWSNRSANMPDNPSGNLSGSDPLSVQGGYNMTVKVKPDNPNVVFVGGTNLYRSTDGFTTNTNTAWINGYSQFPLDYSLYPNGHPDIHELVFNPNNPNEAICADDGGVRRTGNIMAGTGSWPVHPVTWSFLPRYQTLQYYYVAMDPGAGRNNFAGGSQDNGTLLRDKLGLLSTPVEDSNNHRRILGGDGTYVGFGELNQSTQMQFVFGASQYGNIRRLRITPSFATENIRPANLTPAFPGATGEFGEFVTNFRLNPDNTEDLYYINFNRLFRTTSASSVTAGGWTELTGVAFSVNPGNPTAGRNISIRSIAFTRGAYHPGHTMYIGTTQGNIFRLDDPRNIGANAAPANITPFGMIGNVQDIAVNPNNDNEVLAVISNYGTVSIWHTMNGRASNPVWTTAEGNLTLPSIRSCAIIVKKDQNNQPVVEYYVGTSVGLYSTTNINAPVWQREGANILNFAVVRALGYRPSDNVMVVGTHGNGMFYTYLGTPNFNPQVPTPVNVITNDKNFIRTVYPTVTQSQVRFETGNMTILRKIDISVISLKGQTVIKRMSPYQNGSVDLAPLASGAYILTITSTDGRYRHVQKVIKQ